MKFKKTQGALLPDCCPHEQTQLDEKAVVKEVKAQKAIFARYTSGITPPLFKMMRMRML